MLGALLAARDKDEALRVLPSCVVGQCGNQLINRILSGLNGGMREPSGRGEVDATPHCLIPGSLTVQVTL